MTEDNNQNQIIKPAPQKTESHGAVVETLVGDMADVIENDTEGGLVKKIIHGEEEHEQERKNLSPESKKNQIFMLVGALLIFFALAIVSFFIYKNESQVVPIEKQFTPLVFSDQSTFLPIDGLKKDGVAQTVLDEISKTSVKGGGVEGIYLTENKQAIGLRRFITLIGASFVPSDNLAFVSDNFLMGTVKNDGFFILLKMRSISDIFDSLRAWEPKMLSDLHGFLGINIGSDTNYLLTKSFQDGIVENKNARILYDKSGNIVLMYIFADNNSVLVAGNEEAANEIMLRLASNQAGQ